MSVTNDHQMLECAKLCHECQDSCLEMIGHCLDMGGEHAARAHQTMLLDCATICGTSHHFLHRQSPRHTQTCRACGEICRACAEECLRMGGDDQKMIECAEMCRRCADSCERMAGAGV